MKTSSYPVILLLTLVTLIFCGTGEAWEAPVDPDRLLRDLRAREARFDNAALIHTSTGELDERPIPDVTEGYEEYIAPFLYHCHLVVRGDDTTIIRRLDPSTPAQVPDPWGADTISACPFYKARCVSGVSTDIASASDSQTPDPVFVRTSDDQCASFLLARLKRELALGFGWTQYVREVESVIPHGDGILATCTMQIPSKDVISSGTFLLDADLLVREATIETRLFPARWEVRRFSSTGTFEKDAFRCARYGSCSSAVYVRRQDTGEVDEIEREDIHAKCEDIRFDLSDSEYESLVEITASGQGATVRDKINDRKYRVRPGTEIPIGAAGESTAEEESETEDE